MSDDAKAYQRPTWNRGLAHATLDSKYFVIALNVPEVRAPMIGNVTVSVCADGRFGYLDPLNWPQVYCERRPWQALIPRRPDPSSLFHALWDSPTLAEFVAAEEGQAGSTLFGHLCSDWVSRLETVRDVLETEVNSALANEGADPYLREQVETFWSATKNALLMFDVPSTFRDVLRLFAHFHRCWAECAALVTWVNRVKSRYDRGVLNANTGQLNEDNIELASGWGALEVGLTGEGVMGVFCSNRMVAARMMAAGIPVWFLQLKAGTGKQLFGGREEVEMVKELKEVVDEEGIGRASAYASVAGERGASEYARQERAVDSFLSSLAPQEVRTVHAGEEHIVAIWEQSARIVDAEKTPFPANFGEGWTDELDVPTSLTTVRASVKTRE